MPRSPPRALRLASAALLFALGTPSSVRAAGFGGEPPSTDLRLDLSQLYTLDDLTSRHLSFSELRITADQRVSLDESRLELHLDGRARYGWTAITDHRVDVTRAFVSYGSADRRWMASLGRLTIDPVSSARVDGLAFDYGASDTVHLMAFGGLMPHPLTGAPDPSFLLFGAGYEARSDTLHHQGGLAANLYGGRLDRFYLSERVLWRPDPVWVLHGSFVADLVATRGFLGDLLGIDTGAQSALERVDLTSLQLMVRWQPVRTFDLQLFGSHHHALMPNLWWDDYLAEQRARLGFSVPEGFEPVGSRRSSARLIANLRVLPIVTPYAMGSAEYRHEDAGKGFSGTGGLKLDLVELGYLDLSGTWRDSFGVRSFLASLGMGTTFGSRAGFDANVALLRTRLAGSEGPDLLWDVGGALWVDLDALTSSLSGVRLMAMYQAFVEPEVVFQVFMVRVGYRFRAME